MIFRVRTLRRQRGRGIVDRGVAVDTTAYGHVAIVLVVLQMRYRSLTKLPLAYVERMKCSLLQFLFIRGNSYHEACLPR